MPRSSAANWFWSIGRRRALRFEIPGTLRLAFDQRPDMVVDSIGSLCDDQTYQRIVEGLSELPHEVEAA